MHRYPLPIWAGIVFSLALCVSGVYWDEGRVSFSPNSTWATGEQVAAEYRDAQAQLELPEGTEWPAVLPFPATAPDGSRNSYAAGLGTEWAEWRWFDAWARCAVSTSESTASRSAATERLPGFYDTIAFETAATPEYFTRIITAAQEGDSAGLREYVDSINESDAANGGQ